jgi:pimeloyl-ACP methyl ester carboxylesterase/ketosteroid isomerase-like protein
MTHPNEILIRQLFDMFREGQREQAVTLFSEDAVFSYPAQGPLNGEWKGQEGILSFWAEQDRCSGGKFEPELLDLVAGERNVFLLVRIAQHESLRWTRVVVYEILNGAIANARVYEGDSTAAKAFFSKETQLHTVTSRDGTRIAFWRSGSGPPLLLVHGATADHTTTWRFVLSELENRFTVYSMDRRGRGGSGDSSGYDLMREAEDVAAVVDSIGEPVNVVGHSYGALCAMEAALVTPNMRRLILYEGVPLDGSTLYAPGVLDGLEALLDAGDVEEMLITMFREIVEATAKDLETLRSQHDAWAVRLRNAPTLPRELREEMGYTFQAKRFKSMQTPTLFLVGGKSPSRELENANAIADALPDARVVILPEQGHTAMYTAPEIFVWEIVQFLPE